METVYRLLWRVAPYLPDTEHLLSVLIAIAIFGQLYVAYRIWRPKVEIFVQITVAQAEPPILLGRVAHLDIGNLSPAGIWVESISALAEEADGKSGQFEGPAQFLIPAFTTKSVRCDQIFYRAFLKSGRTRGKYMGHVRARCKYRVHQRWRQTGWTQKLYVIVSGERVLQFEGDESPEP